MKRTPIALAATTLLLIPAQGVAHAGTLETLDVSVTWQDAMYKPAKFKCNVYDFDYLNGIGFELLNVRFDILDPYGGSVAWKSAVGVPNGTSGTWNVQICDSQFTNGVGPYTFKLTIKDYNNNTKSTQTQFTFLEQPAPPTPTPPAPTTPPAPPNPLTAQAVTGVPAKVKVGKKARLPRTASSGLPIAWSASPKRVCKLAGAAIRGKKKGKCKVRAAVQGNTVYLPLSQTFAIRVR